MESLFEFIKCVNVKFCKFCRVAVLNNENLVASHITSQNHINAFVNNSNFANDFNINIAINDSLVAIEGAPEELFCTKCLTVLKINNKNKHLKYAKSHTSSGGSVCLDTLVLQSRGIFVWHNFRKRIMLCRACDKGFQCEQGKLKAHRDTQIHKKIIESRLSTSSLESQVGRRSWIFTQKQDHFEFESGEHKNNRWQFHDGM